MNNFGITVYNGKEYRKKLILDRPFYPQNSSFFILKKGHIVYEKRLNTIEINEPVLAFMDSYSAYQFSHISDDIECYVISFTREFIESISQKINSLHIYTFFKENLERQFFLNELQLNELFNFAPLLKSLSDNSNNYKNSKEIIETVFSGLIQSIANYVGETAKSSKKVSRKELISLTFLRNVKENFKKEKNVKFYADKQCLTVRHLSETVKNVIGKTASQIILEFQLKEAKAILLDTDKSIYQIATELGFSDSYTFGHFFKRHERISPSQFRKK